MFLFPRSSTVIFNSIRNSSSPPFSLFRYFSSSSSSPSDYLRSFYLLVHPDRFSSFSQSSSLKPEFVNSVIQQNSTSLALFNSIVDYSRSLNDSPAPSSILSPIPVRSPPFTNISTLKFHFLPPGAPESPKESDFSFIEEKFDFTHTSLISKSTIDQSIYRILLAAKIEIPLEIELKWNEKWKLNRENNNNFNQTMEEEEKEKQFNDPLISALSSEFRDRIKKFPSLRSQLERIRDLSGPKLDFIKEFQWNSNSEINFILQDMIEHSLIQFPPLCSTSNRLKLLSDFGRRLAGPLGRSSIHAWMGIKIKFIETSELECTRTQWNLPIIMSDKEFNHFLIYWIKEFKLIHLVENPGEEFGIEKNIQNIEKNNGEENSDLLMNEKQYNWGLGRKKRKKLKK